MKFVTDESVDRPIVSRLRQEGHQVLYVAEMEPGISDDTVLAIANREAALLLTADKDFGEIVFRRRSFSRGIILLRLAGVSPAGKAGMVIAAIRQHQSELPECFSVIAPGIFRIRRQNLN